ncbi:hypothetical protein LUZ61_011892 [Rhynchospora tenuis]|uniref:Reverse transcriptase zinc-binding domain-containing protein n=1 Tax=Rhynchospora tenuis TaxID=198213 RepID=A0AAD6A1X5_9POAL|nr:hypothetical protein LUZ61_011892 [Rhynchospora tenuis]
MNSICNSLDRFFTIGLPVCMAGDFNAILSISEKFGGNQHWDRQNQIFHNFVFRNGLIDLGFKGPAFTWTNKRYTSTPIFERLDRVLVTPSWIHLYSRAVVLHLPRIYSDHAGILLKWDGSINVGKTFKIEHHWLKDADFLNLCTRSWQACETEDFSVNLMNLTKNIKQWAKGRENPQGKLKRIEEQLITLQSRHPAIQDLNVEQALLRDYYNTEELVNIYWRQRAKQKWILEGDQNTRYFHTQATNRFRKNTISHIKLPNGAISGDDKKVRETIVNFFKDLYCSHEKIAIDEINTWFDSIPSELGHTIPLNEHLNLIEPPDELEIKSVLFQMAPESAPGPDGYTAKFVQHMWPIIKFQLIPQIRKCFNDKVIPPQWLNFSVTLIPKIPDPLQPGQGEKYLGVRLIQPPNYNFGSTQLITDKFNNKLGGWKAHTLSFAGRLVLIKSTLQSLPVYFFSTFLYPKHFLAEKRNSPVSEVFDHENHHWNIQKLKSFLPADAISQILISQTPRIPQISPLCGRCGQTPETPLHAFFDCTFSVATWHVANLPLSILPDTTIPEIISFHQKKFSQRLVALFYNILYCLWNSRNTVLFQKKKENPAHTVFLATILTQNCFRNLLSESKHFQITAHDRIILTDGS